MEVASDGKRSDFLLILGDSLKSLSSTMTKIPLTLDEYFGKDEEETTLSLQLKGFGSSAILGLAAELQTVAKERSVLNFTIGDFSPSEFPVPSALITETTRALEEGHTNYPPPSGTAELKEAIRQLYADAFGVLFPTSSIIIHTGGRPGIYAAYRAIVNKGDTVVYSVPCWSNATYCRMTEAKEVVLTPSPASGFLPSASDIAPYVKEARLICLNTPSNPSGAALKLKELRELCEMILSENERRAAGGERPLYLLFDQMYWMLSWGDEPHRIPQEIFPAMSRYTVIVDGISKCFASTGLQVGWAVAPSSISSLMDSFLSEVGTWAPKPLQRATALLLSDKGTYSAYIDSMKRSVKGRLETLKRGLFELSNEGFEVECIEPEGGIYLAVRFGLIGKSFRGHTFNCGDDIRKYLLHEAGVGILPFRVFGTGEDVEWFRFSVGATSQAQVTEGIARIKDAVRLLK